MLLMSEKDICKQRVKTLEVVRIISHMATDAKKQEEGAQDLVPKTNLYRCQFLVFY